MNFKIGLKLDPLLALSCTIKLSNAGHNYVKAQKNEIDMVMDYWSGCSRMGILG